jgi:hypothetical protein
MLSLITSNRSQKILSSDINFWEDLKYSQVKDSTALAPPSNMQLSKKLLIEIRKFDFWNTTKTRSESYAKSTSSNSHRTILNRSTDGDYYWTLEKPISHCRTAILVESFQYLAKFWKIINCSSSIKQFFGRFLVKLRSIWMKLISSMSNNKRLFSKSLFQVRTP